MNQQCDSKTPCSSLAITFCIFKQMGCNRSGAKKFASCDSSKCAHGA